MSFSQRLSNLEGEAMTFAHLCARQDRKLKHQLEIMERKKLFGVKESGFKSQVYHVLAGDFGQSSVHLSL